MVLLPNWKSLISEYNDIKYNCGHRLVWLGHWPSKC